jgi:hypothetical protein
MRDYAKRKAEQIKQYRDANQELIQRLGKEYRAKHREELNARRREWGGQNKDRVAAKNIEWREENPERALGATRRWREENPEKQAESAKGWRRRNGAHKAMLTRQRQVNMKQATPGWASMEKMNAFYEEARQLTEATGVKYVVDHIVPLQGKLVCGLHCEANLQVITHEANAKKGNKFLC